MKMMLKTRTTKTKIAIMTMVKMIIMMVREQQ